MLTSGLEGLYSVWQEGNNTIEFYDEDGNLLKTVILETERGVAA